MTKKLAFAALPLLLCLAVPALAQMQDGPAGQNSHSIDPTGSSRLDKTSTDLPPDPEGKAEELRLAGNCQAAVPIFRHLLAGNPEFELAQYNLALCLLDLGKAEPDAQRATGLKQEGAAFMLKAASHNMPKAQASLAAMYLDGNGVTADPVQAGTWALIYRGNGARFLTGLPSTLPQLQPRLDAVLTAETWAQAQARADAWSPTQ